MKFYDTLQLSKLSDVLSRGLFLAILLLAACTQNQQEEVEPEVEDPDFIPTDWTDDTHSKGADANFDVVFDDTQVQRFDISVTSERWESMLTDMTNLYGEFGAGSTGGPGGGPGGGLTETDDPIFVPAELFFKDTQWYKVGIRFKGNSSLQSSWQQGILKLSFKLDFDEYEDDYPQIDNQRFYGFKKFSLKNNYDDKSFLREKVAADIFADEGLTVSHTAFYTLYVDHGNGPEYFGLYTLVEEVDNTVIDTQFSSDDGNLYKPEGIGASFVNGSFNSDEFEKKTNEDDNDWSDIQSLFTALHNEKRISDPSVWRENLESIFETDIFLKYLAINTVIQNWDTYGRMTHNYYLYNNPDNGKLTWVPWDNNEALQEGKMGGALSLDFSNIETNSWPLIEYLYADEVYKNKYDGYVLELIDNSFEPNTIKTLYANYSSLVQPYATTEISGYTFLNSSADFAQAIAELDQHADNRANKVDIYLK